MVYCFSVGGLEEFEAGGGIGVVLFGDLFEGRAEAFFVEAIG